MRERRTQLKNPRNHCSSGRRSGAGNAKERPRCSHPVEHRQQWSNPPPRQFKNTLEGATSSTTPPLPTHFEYSASVGKAARLPTLDSTPAQGRQGLRIICRTVASHKRLLGAFPPQASRPLAGFGELKHHPTQPASCRNAHSFKWHKAQNTTSKSATFCTTNTTL